MSEYEPIVLRLGHNSSEEESRQSLLRASRGIATFIREFGSLIALAGAFGAVNKVVPNWAAAIMSTAAVTGATLLAYHYVWLRLRIQLKDEDISTQVRWLSWLINWIGIALLFTAIQIGVIQLSNALGQPLSGR